MQITIDTERENLDAVLRVLSAAYGVEVVLAGAQAPTAPAETVVAAEPAPSRSGRGRRAGAEGGGRARASRGRTSSVSTAQVRAWAREQGLEVPVRGRLSTEIVTAYEQAHS